jgi:hypothetical protein
LDAIRGSAAIRLMPVLTPTPMPRGATWCRVECPRRPAAGVMTLAVVDVDVRSRFWRTTDRADISRVDVHCDGVGSRRRAHPDAERHSFQRARDHGCTPLNSAQPQVGSHGVPRADDPGSRIGRSHRCFRDLPPWGQSRGSVRTDWIRATVTPVRPIQRQWPLGSHSIH